MKNVFILLAFLGFTFPLLAQVSQIANDVTIFSADGLKFTVTFNGTKMNEAPSANVVVNNINDEWVRALIEFEDPTIPAIKKNILQIKGPANPQNAPETVVYEIVKKKGEYQVKWLSRSFKKIQQTQTVIIQNQPAPEPQNGIQISTPGVKLNVALPKNK